MRKLNEFIAERITELSNSVVATPDSYEHLESFAKANGGSMDFLLMQMAINYGYKMAIDDVNEVIN